MRAPQTHDELRSLMMRRDELKEQLNALSQRRAELTQGILTNPVERGALEARLANTDKRIAQMEADLDKANDFVSDGLARGLATDAPTAIKLPQFIWQTGQQELPWRERLLNSLDVTAPITIATVVLLGAVMYWRILRSVRSQFTKLLSMQQARLEEIQRSVDTVAVEMERVSENQRYVTKLVGEKQPAERH